ncbi:MAG: autorepressor SdpR family transcription factor [Chitinophagaceae bacterium]|mgnify:FL=1|nr:autorepressor SdpR family transcription factor [Chitinophagaceae bacterium]
MNDIFKALNDETRRQILELLKEKDRSAGEIAEKFNISKPSISHHLELLKKADLITHEKKGQFIIYSINTSVLDEILTWLIKFQPLFNLKKYEVQLKK